jgi:hypothetical protein
VSQRGSPSRVRPLDAVTADLVPSTAIVRTRMPTPYERGHLDLPDGVPVLVVAIDGEERVYPANRVEIAIDPQTFSPVASDAQSSPGDASPQPDAAAAIDRH